MLFFLLAGLITASTASAQKTANPLEEMRLAFQQLNYVTAREAGERALQDWQKLALPEVVEIHQTLGIIAYTEGDFFEAKAQFEEALSIEPDLKLDSLYVSPKIQQFLRQVQNRMANNGHSRVTFRYLVAPDPRPRAALRSLLLPGWGQMQKQQKGKGRLMMIAAGAGVLATVTLHMRREAARESYLSAQTISKAVSTYKRYNAFNRARNAAAMATSAIWIYSFFDALILLPDQPGPRLSLLPSPEGESVTPGLRWQVNF